MGELRTERLVLAAFSAADEEVLWQQWNDPAVGRYLFDGEAVSREMVRAQLEASARSFQVLGCGLFTISLTEQPSEVVGFTGLRRYGEAGDVEVLYALLPRVWGRGLATEAVRAVLRLGFESGLTEIHAGADVANEASFAVMERLGMSPHRELIVAGRPVRYYRLTRDAAPTLGLQKL